MQARNSASEHKSIVLSEHKTLTQEQYPHFISFTNCTGPHGRHRGIHCFFLQGTSRAWSYISTESCKDWRHRRKTVPETERASCSYIWIERCATRWSAASSRGTAAASMSRPREKGKHCSCKLWPPRKVMTPWRLAEFSFQVRSSLSVFAKEKLASVYLFPSPHSSVSLRH
jgi:hypothetical protein